jgi:hypothetical protein
MSKKGAAHLNIDVELVVVNEAVGQARIGNDGVVHSGDVGDAARDEVHLLARYQVHVGGANWHRSWCSTSSSAALLHVQRCPLVLEPLADFQRQQTEADLQTGDKGKDVGQYGIKLDLRGSSSGEGGGIGYVGTERWEWWWWLRWDGEAVVVATLGWRDGGGGYVGMERRWWWLRWGGEMGAVVVATLGWRDGGGGGG